MVEEAVKKTTALAIALFLLVVLIFVGINPLYSAFKSFLSIGQLENPEVAQLKQQCDDYVNIHGATDGCALNVAAKIVETNGDLFVAQSFLKKEIESTNDQKILNKCFEFARDDLYPKSKDWEGALGIYNELFDKLKTRDVMIAKDEAQLNVYINQVSQIYSKLKYPVSSRDDYGANANFLAVNQELVPTIKKALKLYNGNKEKLNVEQFYFNDYKGDDVCNALYAATGAQDNACNIYARASLDYGCFRQAGLCKSCTSYHKAGVDACSGYDSEDACKTDPCNAGDCSWTGFIGSCKSVRGTVNYWDLS